jgi:steroid delta-isomerase-like uncharacterized protein
MRGILLPMTQQEQNKALVQHFYDEAWNQGNLDVIDELFTPDYEVVNRPAWRAPGTAGLKEFILDNQRVFPDAHHTVIDMVAEGDKVAVYFKATGTHKGDLHGPVGLVPATGKKVQWDGMNIIQITGGKIVQTKGIANNMSLMQQLGAVPTPK